MRRANQPVRHIHTRDCWVTPVLEMDVIVWGGVEGWGAARCTHHIVNDLHSVAHGTSLEPHSSYSIDKFRNCNISSGILVEINARDRL